MLSSEIDKILDNYPDFPKDGILFRDIMPLLREPKIFKDLIEEMSESPIIKDSDAIIAVDARGFIFGSSIALLTQKPFIAARKPGKLPGELISKSYSLEYGKNSLSLQKKAINEYDNFAIVDDLLATGGTVKCIQEIIFSVKKNIAGLVVVIELMDLLGREKLKFNVDSILKY
tara:strand:- start:494 stop:1012 length:519 start_codon:yes stop_codon:yes gene_type:complete